MRIRLAIAAIIGMASVVSIAPARGAASATGGPTASWGYIRTDDGAQLRYSVLRPSSSGRFPVALTYSPYVVGSDPTIDEPQTLRLVGAGYAVLGVNIRGTGCSSGHFDAFE